MNDVLMAESQSGSSPFQRRDRTRVLPFLLLASAVLLAPVGCVLFEETCDTDGERWCDDNHVKVCTYDDDGDWFRDPGFHVDSWGCGDEVCMEWKTHDFRMASCVDKTACQQQSAFCVFGAVATCVEGKQLPQISDCGDQDWEGNYCIEAEGSAFCAWEEEPCEVPGARQCSSAVMSRYFYTCIDGYWTGVDSCRLGEECVLTGLGEVGCSLRSSLETLP